MVGHVMTLSDPEKSRFWPQYA